MVVIGEKRRNLKKKKSTIYPQILETILGGEEKEQGGEIKYLPPKRRTRSARAIEEER